MLKKLLDSLALPSICSREEMLDTLLREEYGYMPPLPESVSVKEGTSESVKECIIHNFCAGKATLNKVDLTVKLYGEDFTFPIYLSIPTKQSASGKGHPFFVHINFRDAIPDLYLPIEEIIDRGYAVISFCYKDVTSDDGDFTNRLAGVITRHEPRGASTPGKIAMWAWAAQRALDYAYTLDCLDKSRAFVCGHSRLGKTALLAAATDGRFKLAYSNDSGCSGAALSRGTKGERIRDICRVFPFWFCENYQKYIDNEQNMPFDQHWLASLIAPRYLYVASAKEDAWADPDCEFLTCVAASESYKQAGVDGIICPDRLPEAGDVFHAGNIGYHLRYGTHYMGREDWNRVIDFAEMKKFD